MTFATQWHAHHTYYNLHLRFYLNTFKIYHSTLLPSVDIVFLDIYILQGSVAT